MILAAWSPSLHSIACSRGAAMRVLLADDLAGRLTTLSLAPQSSSASRLTAGALFVRGHGRRHRRGVFKKAAFAAESSVLLIGDAALVSKGCSASAEIASSISTAFNVLLCCLGDFLAPALQIVAPAAVAKPSSRKAIRLDPKDVPAYNNRGEALQSQGRSRPCHRRLQRGHPAQPGLL
jgi:Tetratricopeptide repeat